MSLPKIITIDLLNSKTYLWIDAILIKENQKAILIKFDDREIWLPKAWIAKIKHKSHCEEQSDKAISIKIKVSEHCWTRKVS